jgi:hypothetical protein
VLGEGGLRKAMLLQELAEGLSGVLGHTVCRQHRVGVPFSAQWLIDYRNFVGATVPLEDPAPLVVDAHAPEVGEIPLQLFEPVRWKSAEIVRRCGTVNMVQHPTGSGDDIRRETTGSSGPDPVEQSLRGVVAEAKNHVPRMAPYRFIVKR